MSLHTRMVSVAKRTVGSGRRTITIERTGWMTGPNQWLDVRYQPNGLVVMGPGRPVSRARRSHARHLDTRPLNTRS